LGARLAATAADGTAAIRISLCIIFEQANGAPLPGDTLGCGWLLVVATAAARLATERAGHCAVVPCAVRCRLDGGRAGAGRIMDCRRAANLATRRTGIAHHPLCP